MLKGIGISMFLVISFVSIEARDALHSAATAGDLELVEDCISRGVNVNHPDTVGQTALHMAVIAGHEAIVRFLLDHGAIVNRPDNDGHTPLYWAELKGNQQIANIIIGHIKRIEYPRIFALATALHGRLGADFLRVFCNMMVLSIKPYSDL